MPIAFTIIFDIFPPEKRGKSVVVWSSLRNFEYLRTVAWCRIDGFPRLALGVLYQYPTRIDCPWSRDGLLSGITGAPDTENRLCRCLYACRRIGLFLLALEMGGKEYAWSSPQILGLFGAALVAFVAFAFAERRAADPVITFSLFRVAYLRQHKAWRSFMDSSSSQRVYSFQSSCKVSLVEARRTPV